MKWLILILVFLFSISSLLADESQNCTLDCASENIGLTSEEIANLDSIQVTTLSVREDLMTDRWYKRLNETVDVYDAPNGNITRTIPAGFNFITAMTETPDGWTQINSTEWVQTSLMSNANWIVSDFTGVLLPEQDLPYMLAWVLTDTFVSSEPGAEPDESNTLLQRYDQVKIYSTAEMYGYRWYQVGADQWVHQHNVGKIIDVEKPAEVTTNLWFSIDLYEQVLVAHRGYTPVYATLISSGLDRWPTREGVFNIFFRRERRNMSGGQPGDDYYSLEESPWTMFFDEGRALHGAYWHDGFGYRRSHGCVNLTLTDAHYIYQMVADEMGSDYTDGWVEEDGPAVYVWSSGVYE